VLTFIGASLLWVGWFGFNAGSAVSAGMQAGMAMTVTQIATAVAALTWMFVEWAYRGTPTLWYLFGCGGGSRRHHTSVRFRRPAGSMVIGLAGAYCAMSGSHGSKRCSIMTMRSIASVCTRSAERRAPS